MVSSRRLRNVRNCCDFWLRTTLRVPGPKVRKEADWDVSLREEVGEFLGLFRWPDSSRREIAIADIGAKNFYLAPELHRFFSDRGFSPEVHGIELDAYRRYRDLRLRKQYGDFYAEKIPRAKYHAIDFLRFAKPLDIAIVLNPFVTEGPLQKWGLPLHFFDPRSIFSHAKNLLTDRRGLLLVSSPNEEEFAKSVALAKEAGFMSLQKQTWFPGPDCIQQQPRLGALFQVI